MTKPYSPVSSYPIIPSEVLERAIELTRANSDLALIDPIAFPKNGVLPYTVERLDSGEYQVSRGVNGSQQILKDAVPESELVDLIREDAHVQEVIPKVTGGSDVTSWESLSRWERRVTQQGKYCCLQVRLEEKTVGVLFPTRFILNPEYLHRGRTPIPEIRPILREIESVYSPTTAPSR